MAVVTVAEIVAVQTGKIFIQVLKRLFSRFFYGIILERENLFLAD